ncbi:ATP-grasp domain-containing protein [Thiolapillus brandeum]|uniref:ATP-grasp domain-containing protein n=1 Tax=Thiolapillus brandeum TaxID=1076588 RepID=A0A7U6GJI4_9GAMM|nr:hypothetical protein [Thiolapillus brandeum]BAO44777.1 conserved hypothetical protein [Thiolapillus brandeum]
MLRVRLVLSYMGWCLRLGVGSWKYFQLNAPWFNGQRRLFSKLDTDQLIPKPWRLHQTPLANTIMPRNWPVFLKPEWGQNARGIAVARNPEDWQRLREPLLQQPVPYLVQEAAPGKHEFEVFFIRRAADQRQAAILSITETLNQGGDDWPVNSILNPDTRHATLSLSREQMQRLWQQISQLPPFRIARVGLRSNSIEAMLDGNFHIIEINLFVPMPLTLLDEGIPLKQRHAFISPAMKALAELTLALPGSQEKKSIFWPMFFLNYRIKP